MDASTQASGDAGQDPDNEFWARYLAAHSSPVNRWMHALGTLLSLVIAAAAIATGTWWCLIFVPLAGYGLAWTGHALAERNRPMTGSAPLRSLVCDYRLTWLMLTGRGTSLAVSSHSVDAAADSRTERT